MTSLDQHKKMLMSCIEELNSENFDAALVLFEQYQGFYQVKDIDEKKNYQHLQMILSAEDHGKVFLIREQDVYTGFATIYYSYSSILAERVAILNDLYVQENHRRKGYSKQLIEHCFDYLKDQGITTVRWTTSQDNNVAQQVYKNYASATKWFMYTYHLT